MSRWKAVVMASGVAAASVFAGGSEADARLSKLVGSLNTHQVECDTMCTTGPLTGGLAGELHWRMDTMQSTGDPDVVTFVGVNTITTEHGTLAGTDYGIWNLVTGDFVDFTVFSSGTGDYEGARGTLLIVGKFDPVEAVGSSRYISFVH